jgi:hypothetical protein
MSRRVLPLAVLSTVALLASPIATLAQGRFPAVSSSDVPALVTLGRADKFSKFVKTCSAEKPSSGLMAGLAGVAAGKLAEALVSGIAANRGFDVSMMGPRGRIAQWAWTETQQGRTPTAADVPEELLENGLLVHVEPHMPDVDDDALIPPTITAAQINVKNEVHDQVVSPSAPIDLTTRTWKNTKGATVDYTVANAWFPLAKLQGISSKDRAILAIATDAGARVCEFRDGREWIDVLTRK